MATATQTHVQINGDKPTYEAKFLPKVNAIPVVQSFKKQVYTHVPHAENITKYVGDHLSTAFKYTDDTPIQGALKKLDSLAADGVERLEKQVPMVNAQPQEILKKTQVDKLLGFITHYYTVLVSFVFSLFNTYQNLFDPILLPALDRIEIFLDTTSTGPESKGERIKRIYAVAVEKVDNQVTPVINRTKETISAIYTSKVLPVAQFPLGLFTTQKDKAAESVSPYVHGVNSRITKAESAAKDAWIQTRPDISGPNSVIPTLKSGVFAALTFGYKVVYPEKPKEEAEDKAAKTQEQSNGLVSGVDLSDGGIHKRPNGVAS
jgi:hypothetical protein